MHQAVAKLEAALKENEFVSITNMNVAQVRYIYGSLNLYYLNQIVQNEVSQAAQFTNEEMMMASSFGDMAIEIIQINHTLGLPSLSEYQIKETHYFVSSIFELFARVDQALSRLSLALLTVDPEKGEQIDQTLLTDVLDLIASLAHYCGFSLKNSIVLAVDDFINYLL